MEVWLLIVVIVAAVIMTVVQCIPQKKEKPIFGVLKIDLQDPNEDMFKLEINISDPNELLKHREVTLKIVEVSSNSRMKRPL